MQFMPRQALDLVLVATLVASQLVFAQDQPSAAERPATTPHTGAAERPAAPTVRTGKERLGRKWMDEQRIDNCNVPLDKRGTKPRPDTCSHVPED